jgi:ketosteroid isomerase-like protein
MSQENVDLIRGAYEDFNGGNIEGVTSRLADDVEWTEPGGGKAPSGTFNGPDSVANDVFAAVPQHFDEFQCIPEETSDEGDTVRVGVHFKGKAKSGAELDTPAEHVWEIRDGNVVRFEHTTEGDAWAQAWS